MSIESSKKIFNSLQTRQKVNEFLRFHALVMTMSHRVGDVDFESLIKDMFEDGDPVWLSVIRQELPTLFSGEIRKNDIEVLDEVKNMVENSNQVKVEMSFEPSDQFINDFINILKSNLGNSLDKGFIVEFNVVSGMGLGAKFYMNGQFLDLTVRSQVKNYLISNDVVSKYI
jgi:hypothetical protein